MAKQVAIIRNEINICNQSTQTKSRPSSGQSSFVYKDSNSMKDHEAELIFNDPSLDKPSKVAIDTRYSKFREIKYSSS